MHIVIRMYANNDSADSEFMARIVPTKDIVMVDAHLSEPNYCWAMIKNLPEQEPDETETECLLDHSLEEIAKALGCEVSHMDTNFVRAPLPAFIKGARERPQTPPQEDPSP